MPLPDERKIMTTNTSRRSFLIGTGGAALAVTLGACSSSPGSSSGGGGTAGSKTLTLTTNSDDDTSTWEVPQWNKQNPSTQIKLETYDTNTYTSTFPTLATSNDAPNIAGYFIDGGNYTTLAKAGAFVELSDVWAATGLTKALPQFVVDLYHNFTPDKKVYAVPTNCSTYGILFYSRAALKKAGVPEPVNNAFSSLSEFESALQAAKKAGLAGIAVGGKDGYPLSHMQDGILSSFMTPDQVKNVLSIDYTSSEWLTPVQTMVDWAKAGYLAPGYLGMAADDSKTYFAQGKSMFCSAINVWLPDLITAGMKQSDIGWVLFPQVGPMTSKMSYYAGGGLVIPIKSAGDQGHAAATKFVEWAVSPAIALENAQKVNAFQGRTDVPGLVNALGPVVASMVKFTTTPNAIQQGWDDPAPADMITYDRDNLQAVLAGSLSVSAFGAALQQLATTHKTTGQ
jgi:ABC-type glycerol-3-phosphate transport system substrate-binding protein